MLEYADTGGITKSLLKKAARAKALMPFHEHGVLAPLEDGRYEVLLEKLRSSADGYEDEIGVCVSRTRIVRAASQATKKPKAATAKKTRPKTAKFEVGYLGPCAEPWGSTQGLEPFDFIALDAADAARYDGDDDFACAFDIVARKIRCRRTRRGRPRCRRPRAEWRAGRGPRGGARESRRGCP